MDGFDGLILYRLCPLMTDQNLNKDHFAKPNLFCKVIVFKAVGYSCDFFFKLIILRALSRSAKF